MQRSSFRKLGILCCACATATLAAATASAKDTGTLSQYYVGVDTSPEVAFGEYIGLDNPNFNRLTFLFNHANYDNVESSHYHSIGRYTYTGPAGSPTVVDTNSNNRLPETYTGDVLYLAPGSGAYAGKLVSGVDDGSAAFAEYGELEMRLTDSIPSTDGFGPLGETGTTNVGNAAYYLFNSSSQSYVDPVGGLDIELELVGLTSGLSIGDAAGNVLMDSVGDTADLFDSVGTFTPTFFTDASATPGVYSASFRLNDNSGTYGSSGTFHFDFTVAAVPEPASLAAAGLSGLVLLRRRR